MGKKNDAIVEILLTVGPALRSARREADRWHENYLELGEMDRRAFDQEFEKGVRDGAAQRKELVEILEQLCEAPGEETATTEEWNAFCRAKKDARALLSRLERKAVARKRRGELDSEELLESLAALEHERWSGWMRYQAEHCELSDFDTHPSGENYGSRWLRLVHTPYEELTEEEKESDRVEARKTLALLCRLRKGGMLCEETEEAR